MKGKLTPARLMAAMAVACLSIPSGAQALDQKIGQHWRCVASDGGSDIEYAIGHLETVGDALGKGVPAEKVRLAHLHVWEAHEFGVGREVAHMPMQANRVACAGQIYIGEGMEIPDSFATAYATWAAEAEAGRAQWFLAPVDVMFKATREIIRKDAP